MNRDATLILGWQEVRALLDGREHEVVEAVREAYEIHGSGDSSLPHSIFLRFPEAPANRIIALPAYLGGDHDIAGLKWVASFPANLERGMDRASAVLILNSARTGRPEAIIEGSLISAQRTAASAALAARTLLDGEPVNAVGMIGCGPINLTVAQFLFHVWPEIRQLTVYDTQPSRAEYFVQKCRQGFGAVNVSIADEIETVLQRHTLVSFATTASEPHVRDLSACRPGSVILHVSLRDLSPEALLGCDNVVDDVDHVCRAQTSLHLAEQQVGHRDFIRCTLSDILRRLAPATPGDGRVTVFSPFGLGVLDLAVGQLVYRRALERDVGLRVESFLPRPWSDDASDG